MTSKNQETRGIEMKNRTKVEIECEIDIRVKRVAAIGTRSGIEVRVEGGTGIKSESASAARRSVVIERNHQEDKVSAFGPRSLQKSEKSDISRAISSD
ncbi:hypothetical protein EVAR_102424_1 [Eumeta japonica]|uniref:Uncharacterized protein n=1 Tax=Eumeta variegata TaxID=151549 RepID=A0A4C1Z0B3_EUMVA|nr:hypothetical protein EVAR_102424_1 [Eumeta japonica]